VLKKVLGGMSMAISQVPKAKGAWFIGSLRGCGVSQKNVFLLLTTDQYLDDFVSCFFKIFLTDPMVH
jgi:hypothetical protein